MVFHRLKKMLYLCLLFTLTVQSMHLYAGDFSALSRRAVAANAQASGATSLLCACFTGYGTYLFGKETIKAYNEKFNYYYLTVALGIAITMGCGIVTLALLQNASACKQIAAILRSQG